MSVSPSTEKALLHRIYELFLSMHMQYLNVIFYTYVHNKHAQ
jgi:hypothetical protein